MPIPAKAREGLDRLAATDPTLACIEAEAGPLPWRVRTPGFPGLLSAIVGQQISNQAAAAIWRRCIALPGSLAPETFLEIDPEALRGAGLSRPKIAHGRAVAEAFATGHLATERLAAMEDAAAIAALSAVRGLGVWSAEIYLLFALERHDVFPAGDLALQAATADLRGLATRPTPAVLREIALGWAPYRALAARLLWHWWRFKSGRAGMDD